MIPVKTFYRSTPAKIGVSQVTERLDKNCNLPQNDSYHAYLQAHYTCPILVYSHDILPYLFYVG